MFSVTRGLHHSETVSCESPGPGPVRSVSREKEAGDTTWSQTQSTRTTDTTGTWTGSVSSSRQVIISRQERVKSVLYSQYPRLGDIENNKKNILYSVKWLVTITRILFFNIRLKE